MGVIASVVTIVPVIVSGSANMVFVKTKTARRFPVPIDVGHICRDGRPLFGKNKTWVGMAGMVFFTAIACMVWGITAHIWPAVEQYNFLYRFHDNTVWFNLCAGTLIGLAYIVAELPNSFIKRRLAIMPGKMTRKSQVWAQFIGDHIDSTIGCALVVGYFSQFSVAECVTFILTGFAIHAVVVAILVALHVKDAA